MFQRVRVAVGAVAALLATNVASAQSVASLNDTLMTRCSKEELGRVTTAKVLDQLKAAPSQAELTELVGKPQCAFAAED